MLLPSRYTIRHMLSNLSAIPSLQFQLLLCHDTNNERSPNRTEIWYFCSTNQGRATDAGNHRFGFPNRDYPLPGDGGLIIAVGMHSKFLIIIVSRF
jgi:hypothetical protein